MYLCHKCAGVLMSNPSEDTTGLLGCACISSYYRGFEPALTREQALADQIKQQDIWLRVYERQGRTDQDQSVREVRAARTRLMALAG